MSDYLDRRVEDFPQKEVARRVGITEKAVEKALARGVELLARSVLCRSVHELLADWRCGLAV